MGFQICWLVIETRVESLAIGSKIVGFGELAARLLEASFITSHI